MFIRKVLNDVKSERLKINKFQTTKFTLTLIIEASKTSTNITGVIFIKELNDVSSVTSGGLHQVKAEHNAHRI